MTKTTGNNDKMEFDNETDINNEMEVDDETGISDEMGPLTKKLPKNESEKSQFVKKGKFSDRALEIYYWMIRMILMKTMTMGRSTLRHRISIMMSQNFLLTLLPY